MSDIGSVTSRPVRERTTDPKLEVDGILSERLVNLRQKRGGILSAMTKKDKEIRGMMLQCDPVADVTNNMQTYAGLQDKFNECRKQYISLVADDPDESCKVEDYYQAVKLRGEMLYSDVNEYVGRETMQLKYMGHTGGRIPLTDEVKPRDSASQAGKSGHSNASSGGARAAAKKAALLVRARALKQRLELRLKQIKLDQAVEKLALDTEIAAAEAEEEVYAKFSSVGADRKRQDLPREQLAKRENELQDRVSRHGRSDPSAQQRAHELEYSLEMAVGVNSDEPMLLIQQQMLNMMQLPKTELMNYNGDPLKYWMFIRAFEHSLENTGVSVGVKFNRLFQYCTGKALEVIECCSVMDPEIDYNEARILLKERFGNPYVISKAWVEKVTEGPCLKYGDNSALRRYADNMRSCVATLKAMDRLGEVDNQIRMRAILEKLPSFLQGRWRTEAVRHLKVRGVYPDISRLVDFIDTAAEKVNDPVFGTGNNPSRDFKGKYSLRGSFGKTAGVNFNVETSKNTEDKSSMNKFPPCRYCSGRHAIYVCDKFKQLTIEKRLEFVRTNKLCYNCFSSQHMSYSCGKPSKCHVNGCTRKHSRLLHLMSAHEETLVKSPYRNEHVSNIENQTVSLNSAMCGASGTSVARVALPIVPIAVKVNGQQNYLTTYALLDTGSTHTFISQSFADKLDLKGVKTTLSLTTLNKEKSESDTSLVSLDVADVSGRQLMHLSHVFVIPKLPVLKDSIVSQEDVDKWPHLERIHLPTIEQDSVTLLIGQDVPMALMPLDVRRGNPGEPYAIRTVFGWTLNGPLMYGNHMNAVSNFDKADQILQMQIEKFWKLDTCESTILKDVPQMSVNDKRVVDIWNESAKIIDGHYEMSIPFKAEPQVMPNNYSIAECRLESLGRRLFKNEQMYQKYKSGIQDLLDKGYAEKVSETEVNTSEGPVWYLPHHGVTNENKPDKLRIVFDCGAKFGDVASMKLFTRDRI